MDSAYPAIADCAVTAAAMRAAASIIEESALAGLSVTCDSGQIPPCRSARRREPGRARRAGRPAAAAIAGTHAYQHDSRTTALFQIKACGLARGIPVVIFTSIRSADPARAHWPGSRWPPGPAASTPRSRTGSFRAGGGGAPNWDPEPASAPGQQVA